jgi:hypothetical protein
MIAVVIPWRAGTCPHRIAAAAYVEDYYRRLNLGPVIVTDDGNTDGPFNRSAAYNRGYAQVPAGIDVVLWNEADTVIPRAQVLAAADLAGQAPGIVVPFTERHELSRAQAQRVLTGQADPTVMVGAEKVYTDGISIGQAGVTSRATVDAAGGWCEAFRGWGYDDTAMFYVFKVLAGGPRWVDGPGIHLWHPHALRQQTDEQREASLANRRLSRHMRTLNVDELRAFLAEQERP